MNKLYTKDHFWLEKVVPDSPIRGAILPRLNQENLYIFGATEHGIHELGEVVAIDVYQGNYKANEAFGTIESRKAVVDLTISVPCTLVRENQLMGREDIKYLQSFNENPEQVWIALLELDTSCSSNVSFMSKNQYDRFCTKTD